MVSDPRVVLRKELKKLSDRDLLKRYCKLAGRLFNDEKHRYRLMSNDHFENTSNAHRDREFLTDMIVAYETDRG